MTNIGIILPPRQTEIMIDDLRDSISDALRSICYTADQPVIFHLVPGKKALEIVKEITASIENATGMTHPIHKGDHGREAQRAAGRMLKAIDRLIIFQSATAPRYLPHEKTAIKKAITAKMEIEIVKIRHNPNANARAKATAKAPIMTVSYRMDLHRFNTLDEAITAGKNARHNDPLYCGRANEGKQAPQSILANSHRKKNATAENIAKYREDLHAEIMEGNPAILAELRKIKIDTPLICWCSKAKECHTDVIRSAAAWIADVDAFIIAQIASDPQRLRKQTGQKASVLYSYTGRDRKERHNAQITPRLLSYMEAERAEANTAQARINREFTREFMTGNVIITELAEEKAELATATA
ncbi:hypothetical protein DRQ25_08085 [Candidatus Fermentibacteria bacterium]|nr:MAG: hypothetical protein DRQ25_08085 [Candidatus Fermentibacteria bacterium]